MELDEITKYKYKEVYDLETPKKFENMRRELEIISEKTRYKILLTLLASEESLSFSRLRVLLPSVPENTLNYHLKILKENSFIKIL